MRLTSENKPIQILGKLGELVLLNFLVILLCLPVITAGAAFSAAYRVLLRREDAYEHVTTTEFFLAFGECFRTVTPAWLLLLAGFAVGAGDLFYAVAIAGMQVSSS